MWENCRGVLLCGRKRTGWAVGDMGLTWRWPLPFEMWQNGLQTLPSLMIRWFHQRRWLPEFIFNLEIWVGISSALGAGTNGSCLTKKGANRGGTAHGSVGIATCSPGHSGPSVKGSQRRAPRAMFQDLVTLRLLEPPIRYQLDKPILTWMKGNCTSVCWNVFWV